jgi:site-specific recombinase XerD
LSELDLDGRDPKTITRNRLSFERFQVWLDGEGIVANEVTETDLRVYFVKALSTLVSERTVETEAQHVKTAYVYAFEDRLISENAVTRRVKVPKAVTPEPTPYSMTEMRQLRAAVRDDLDDLIFTAYAYAGLRRNELVDLSRADVDLDEGILCIVGKGNKPRRVPIHPILNRCLAFYMARHPSAIPFSARAAPLATSISASAIGFVAPG